MTTADDVHPARVFWIYWSAQTASSLGTAVTSIAIPLLAVSVLQVSGVEMGLISAAGYVAWLVIGLPAGVITQRLPLRGTQVGMDLIRVLAVASIPIAWWLGHLTVIHLIVAAVVVSFADVLFDVANSTFLPAIVGPDQLHARNSLTSATFSVTQLGGPALGGMLVQLLGAVPTLLVDAASYLASATLLRSLPPRRVDAPDAWPPIRAMIREGWRYVAHHPIMGPCTWSATAINFVCGAQLALFPLYLVREQHAPAGLVGLLIGSEGVGSLIAAALTPRFTRRVGTARACVLAGFIAAGGSLLLPIGSGAVALVLFALGNMVFAAGVVIFSITTRTYRQTESPPELLSRVMATVRFVSWGAIPVGSLVAGVTAQWTGARGALLLVVGVAALPPIILLASAVGGRRDLASDNLVTASRA